MHILPETVAYWCLVAACIVPPTLGTSLFVMAVGGTNQAKANRVVALVLSTVIFAVWLPLITAMPLIAQSMKLVPA
jgi:hypothetical protein